MGRIKTIIIDDEPLARERIRDLLKSDPQIEIVSECRNGEEAVEKINRDNPDLIFLDIQMPKLNGFEVITQLKKIPVTVFVTAFDKYAIKAFEVNALDYLLKPYDKERFQTALNRAKKNLASHAEPKLINKIESLLEGIEREKEDYIERFVIKSGGRIFFVNAYDVDWFEAEGNYIKLHIGKKTELIRETIKNLEAKLNPKKFIRTHRSSIINIDSIKEMVLWFGNEFKIILKNGDDVVTGKKYKENISKLLK